MAEEKLLHIQGNLYKYYAKLVVQVFYMNCYNLTKKRKNKQQKKFAPRGSSCTCFSLLKVFILRNLEFNKFSPICSNHYSFQASPFLLLHWQNVFVFLARISTVFLIVVASQLHQHNHPTRLHRFVCVL